VLNGEHVVDPRSEMNVVYDVAVAKGKVAIVSIGLDPADMLKVVDGSGSYVTRNLVDIHVHVYAGTGEKGSYAGGNI
jgi:dihydroorotase